MDHFALITDLAGRRIRVAHLWGPLEVGDGFPSRKVISCGSSFKQSALFIFMFLFFLNLGQLWECLAFWVF